MGIEEPIGVPTASSAYLQGPSLSLGASPGVDAAWPYYSPTIDRGSHTAYVSVECCRHRMRREEPPDDRVRWRLMRVDCPTMMDRSAARYAPERIVLGAPCRSREQRRHDHCGEVGEGRTLQVDGLNRIPNGRETSCERDRAAGHVLLARATCEDATL